MKRPTPSEFVLVAQAAVLTSYCIWLVGVQSGFAMFDYLDFRSAGYAVLHGHSPYPPATVHALMLAKQLVYPPLVAYLFVPFALLPVGVGGAIFFVLMIAAFCAALRVVGLRDWRCFVVPFVAYPMATTFGNGTLGPFLALLLALAWRYRDRTRYVAPLLAIAIVAKLFLWPVGLWLLATRRWRSAAWTAVLTVVVFLAPFAPLGLRTLEAYPHLLRMLDAVWGPLSYTPRALLRDLGASQAVAAATVAALGVVLAATILVLARARRDDAAFATSICAALLLTPIAWPHYCLLLYVALAIRRPRLSPVWFSFLAFYALPGLNTAGSPSRAAIGVAVVTVVLVSCVRRQPLAFGVRRPGRTTIAGAPVTATIE